VRVRGFPPPLHRFLIIMPLSPSPRLFFSVPSGKAAVSVWLIFFLLRCKVRLAPGCHWLRQCLFKTNKLPDVEIKVGASLHFQTASFHHFLILSATSLPLPVSHSSRPSSPCPPCLWRESPRLPRLLPAIPCAASLSSFSHSPPHSSPAAPGPTSGPTSPTPSTAPATAPAAHSNATTISNPATTGKPKPPKNINSNTPDLPPPPLHSRRMGCSYPTTHRLFFILRARRRGRRASMVNLLSFVLFAPFRG
jgi:hypothetical protein